MTLRFAHWAFNDFVLATFFFVSEWLCCCVTIHVNDAVCILLKCVCCDNKRNEQEHHNLFRKCMMCHAKLCHNQINKQDRWNARNNNIIIYSKNEWCVMQTFMTIKSTNKKRKDYFRKCVMCNTWYFYDNQNQRTRQIERNEKQHHHLFQKCMMYHANLYDNQINDQETWGLISKMRDV